MNYKRNKRNKKVLYSYNHGGNKKTYKRRRENYCLLDKVFLQTRVLISRAKNTFPFLERSSFHRRTLVHLLSNYPRFYIYIYTLKITVSKKQDAINRQDEYHHYVSVILNQNFLTFARRKLSSLRSATAYRCRLYFAVLSRLITAAKMYRSPFSTRCSRISFPRFDSIPSIWKEEETSFLSLEARNRRFVRKGVCLCRFVSKIIPLNTE